MAFYAIDRNRITDGQADNGTGWITNFIIEEGSANGSTAGVSRKNASNEATLNAGQTLSTSDGWATVQIAFRSEAPVGGILQFVNQDGEDLA